MIDLRSLEVFFWVVKLGGFGRAGERLHRTQPAVSARIAQIEARCGFRLLNRNGQRAPAPTPKGMELYDYAERILTLHAEMMAGLTGPAELAGMLRLGVVETVVQTSLGTLLRELHRLNPRVTPEIMVETSPGLRAALLAGELDLALMLGPVADPRVRNLPLRDFALAWVAGRDLGVGDGPVDLAELAAWPRRAYARGPLPHAPLAELLSRPDLPSPRLFANSSLATIVRMAVDGIGIGVVPRAAVELEIADGRLRLLDVAAELPPLHLTASYLADPEDNLAEAVAQLAARVMQGL